MVAEAYGGVVADFDKCERIIRNTLTDLSRERFDVSARKIYRLPARQKIAIIKGKSQPETSMFLKRVDISLKKQFKGIKRPKFVSSDNNRSGKDLKEVWSKRDIEIKSGKFMTDANCGIRIVAWAIECDYRTLAKIMQGGCKERQIGIISKGWGVVEVNRSKLKSMRLLNKLFLKSVKPGRAVRPKLEHFCRCVASGITNGDEITNSFTSQKRLRKPLKLILDWDKGVVQFDKSFLANDSICCIENDETASRIKLVIEGTKSKRKLKIYPNYKNAYVDSKSKQKLKAANWVANPCFQVWIE